MTMMHVPHAERMVLIYFECQRARSPERNLKMPCVQKCM